MGILVEVAPNLLMGSLEFAKDEEFLVKKNIVAVLSCGKYEIFWCKRNHSKTTRKQLESLVNLSSSISEQCPSLHLDSSSLNISSVLSNDIYSGTVSSLYLPSSLPSVTNSEDADKTEIFCGKKNYECHTDSLSYMPETDLSEKIMHVYSFQHMIIDLLNEETADVLQFLDVSIEFIDKFLNLSENEGNCNNGQNAVDKSHKAVLVHCWAGESRSAVVCLAYIMLKTGEDFETAYKKLRALHNKCKINENFINQLKLYKKMKFSLKGDSEAHWKYNLWRNSTFTMNSVLFEINCLSNDTMYYYKYACKKCRMTLFNNCNVLTHNTQNMSKAKTFKRGEAPKQHSATCLCTSIFLEPMEWMGNLENQTGRLLCANKRCGYKLGAWSWYGLQCSCGIWHTPGFQVHRSKVDCLPSTGD